jgi:anti-sigma B factor antagonist
MPGGQSLEVMVDEREGVTIVAPQGEIAYTEATQFQAAVRRASAPKPARLIVDLTRVEYMNTPGLAVLVEALQGARKSKTRLILCGINPRVKAIFQIAKLNTVFEIVDSVEIALTS